jgi:hypothetical protein
MESILGISSKYMGAKEAQAHLQMPVQSHEEIHSKYKSKLEMRVGGEQMKFNIDKFLEFLPDPSMGLKTNFHKPSSKVTHMISFFAGPVQQKCTVSFLFIHGLFNKIVNNTFSCIHYTALNDKMVLYDEVEMVL